MVGMPANDKSKMVVITGVTKGLGRAMLERFSEAGWLVVGCGRSAREIEVLRERFGAKHDFQVVDVADHRAVADWGEKVCARYGPPHLLINNASIVNKSAPLWTVSAEEFSAVMNVNISGVVNVIRAFVPVMVEQKRGVIVNISSYWGRIGEAMVAPYCASKFAIEGLTQSLAKELPEGMAAVALDPGGSIDTQMLRACAPEEVADSPTPDAWSSVAVPYMLTIGPQDNGKSLTCPRP
jgi:NAD(P)-dependent dehydrogenase (short-subunit alcohol dehydrogenase family)